MSDDAVLVSERTHLEQSHQALRTMRARTERLIDAGATAGNAVSTASLHRALWQRMRSLEDDPDVPLFFGRLDYDRALGAEHDERLYIGRRHVTGDSGAEPLVIDWRAPMARPFYRARPGASMAVRRRRRFGFSHGHLTAFEDEDLAQPTATGSLASEILEAEIERPRTGPMRDIVATIQPEQDELVRAELSQSLCVQGAPGTGKTAVGLHRAAFLLYAFRHQLSRQGVLVIGPNDSFLSYIGDVLPALGEIEVVQHTIASMISEAVGWPVRATEDPTVTMIKSSPVMAQVIDRALWGQVREPTDTLVYPSGSRQFRVPAYRAAELITELVDRGVRYEAGRQMLSQRLANDILIKMAAGGDAPDDRVQAAVARSRPVKSFVAQCWPSVDGAKLILRLLTDRDLLARAAEGLLDPEEQDRLIWAKPARTPKSAPWSPADLVLIDEANDGLVRTPSVGHLIVDEAQDLSPMQLRAAGRRASTGSVTVLGDLAQATTPWATSAWRDSLSHLGHPDARVQELLAGFRVPGAVIDYAARLLPSIAPGLAPPYSVRHSRGELAFHPGGVAEIRAAAEHLAQHDGTVGVIVPDDLVGPVSQGWAVEHGVLGEDDTAQRLQVVGAGLAKGLEFDHVVLGEPAAIVAGEPDRRTGLRRLYVCLTRAVSRLVVVHDQPLPVELGA